ncbi:hypothetical protein [Desmospora profundinema]|uniref:Uncharacterized protein n=1 Tax=Desmospora profundinema TaxID=1571184 RepID=A0ABU1IRJ9_9BACL|nr:hypothetical protein [Desmospora profundinema]MDR6227316.1 hypothetical protein [Desmospora profundinema]
MSANTDSQLAKRTDMKLFSGEKLLVIVSLIGFALAAGIAVYISIYGAIILPEGNAESAFSFNAAMGMFILSIAAILPVSGLSPGKRASVRWFFIVAALYSYAVETIQHLRGINPRFSQVGTVVDQIAGGLFGVIALLIVIATALFAIPFFRKRQPGERPLLVLGIRYAFVSTMIAHAAGIWMIVLQSRYTGEAGNLIVLHGLGFHALQALPVLGWLLERSRTDEKRTRQLIHTGGIAWTLAIILIGLQTALARSVFELAMLPFLAGALLLVWLVTVVIAAVGLLKIRKGSMVQTNTVSGEENRDLV